MVGEPVEDPEILGTGAGIGIRKGDDALKEKFNAALEAIIASGEYKTINEANSGKLAAAVVGGSAADGERGEYLPLLLQGLRMTLLLAVSTLIVGLALGNAVGARQAVADAWLSRPVYAVTNFLRGIPDS